jgi:hypothetical protein
MPTRTALAALLVAGSACRGQGSAPVSPLGDEGEVYVYALPLPRDAERLSFTVEGSLLRRQDGGECRSRSRSGRSRARSTRISGSSRGAALVQASTRASGEDRVRDARSEGERSRLLVDPEPSRVDIALRIASGKAMVVWLGLGPAPVRSDFSFAPQFTATIRRRRRRRWRSTARARDGERLRRRPGSGSSPASAPVGERRAHRARREGQPGVRGLFREDQVEIWTWQRARPWTDPALARDSPGTWRSRPTDAPRRDGALPHGLLRRSASMAEVGRVQVGDDPGGCSSTGPASAPTWPTAAPAPSP